MFYDVIVSNIFIALITVMYNICVSHELQPVTARSLIDHLEPPFF